MEVEGSGGRKRRGAHGSRPAAWLPGDYFITADNEDRAICPPDLVKTMGGRWEAGITDATDLPASQPPFGAASHASERMG